MEQNDSLRREFANPGPDFRGAPFWSWNDRLEPSELARQIRDMKAHGMGGFFMHSRDGLETTYMGPEWMACIREAVRVAREEGANAWLYDEDRWPSGAAGGLVPARGGDAFRAKVITLEDALRVPDDDDEEDGELLAVFKGTIVHGTVSDLERVAPDNPPALGDGQYFMVLRREVSGPSEWFNDDAYADNLNPDAVAAFIDITYEAYRREIGDEFGQTVPGIFTDEPNIFAATVRSQRRALPWTDGLPAYFAEKRGYDLMDVLPWLFYEGDGAAKARHDFWYTISQRYTEAYSKQLGDWCEDNHLAFTGHYLFENELDRAIIAEGAIMPHYRHQHVPGIDMLTEQNHEFLAIKQCTSVANQFGRKWVLSETYGCSSWEFTFEGQKWVGDWQYVLGVNLRCQHLALYTLRGCRKRDYPPVFNYNTTWWKYNAVVEDYFARLGCVLTEGEAVRDVLLLHPVSTGWSMVGENAASRFATLAYGENLNSFVQALLATHYDFDFGDEQIMAADAAIESDAVIRVGRAPYRVVVVPPDTRTLLPETVSLLERFLAAGGRVVAMTPAPTQVAAEPDASLADLWRHPGVTLLDNVAGLQAALEGATPRQVSFQTDAGQQAPHLLYMQRRLGERSAFFVVNNDRDHDIDVTVTLAGQGRLEAWDPLTGEVQALPADSADGRLTFPAHLGPAGSRLYVIDHEAVSLPAAAPNAIDFRADRHVDRARFIGPSCTFTRTDPNVLTLDMCRYRLAGGPTSDVMEVWRAQNEVRAALGMRPNYYNGLPQRYKWALAPHPADGTEVSLAFNFHVEQIPAQPVHLLVEGADQFEINLNGTRVPNRAIGWYLDRSFHKVLLPQLQSGANTLELVCRYTNHTELEDCFLIGDFGVSTERTIIAEPARLHFGDWTSQGYLHYAGSMIYHGQIDHDPQAGAHLRLYPGRYEAVSLAVWVNGTRIGHIPWRDATGLDLAPYLAKGLNNVDIEVVSSPRNMLGPLHLAPGREPWTDWYAFRRTDETYTPDYVVKAWGLIDQIRLLYED